MALIKCKECGKEMSDKAKICPHCGLEQNKKKRVIITSIIVIGIVFVTLGIVKVFLINGGIGNTIKIYERKQEQKKEEQKAEEELKPYLGNWKLVKSEEKNCFNKYNYDNMKGTEAYKDYDWIEENEDRYCYLETYSDNNFPKEKISVTKDKVFVTPEDVCPSNYEYCLYENTFRINSNYRFILKDNQLVYESSYSDFSVVIIYERAN